MPDTKKKVVGYFFMEKPCIKFQNPRNQVSLDMTYTKMREDRTGGRTDGRTNERTNVK